MEYHNGVYCVSARELIDGGIMTQGSYAKAAQRKRIDVVRHGGGQGRYALVSVESLPTECQILINEKYGDKSIRIAAWVQDNYIVDQAAMSFFNNPEKTGIHNLSIDKRREYVVNASILNICIRLHDNITTWQRLMGKKYDWICMSSAIESLKVQLGHTLPSSASRFRKKVNNYRKHGYTALLSAKFGNKNALKNK